MNKLTCLTLSSVIALFSISSRAETNDPKYTVSREELNEQFANFDDTLSQARKIPVMRDGKVIGYTRMSKPAPTRTGASIYENLELKEVKTITDLNPGPSN